MMDLTIQIKGRDLDVNFEVEDITLAKSGIGWYEFWGARCYDAGVTYVDDFTVTAVTVYSERCNSYVAPSPRLLTAITEAIYDDEGIREDLLERAEAEAEAARDAYHESKLDAMRGAEQGAEYYLQVLAFKNSIFSPTSSDNTRHRSEPKAYRFVLDIRNTR